MIRIIYEQADKDCEGSTVEMMGTRSELVRGLARIVYSFHDRIGLDVERFAVTLPALVKLEELSLRGTVAIDRTKIKQEDDKHE